MKRVFRAIWMVFLLFELSACGTSGSAGSGEPQVSSIRDHGSSSYINLSVTSVEVLKSGNDPDGTEELRLIMVISTPDGRSTGLMCPGNEPLVTQIHKTEKPCLSGFSLEETRLPDEVVLLIVGVDEDQLSAKDEGIAEAVLTGLGTATGAMLFGPGGSFLGSLAFDLVFDGLSGVAKDYFEQQDILGSQVMLLERSKGWSAGKDLEIITQDQGLKLTLSIVRSTSPEKSDWFGLPQFDITPRAQAPGGSRGQSGIDQSPEDMLRAYYAAISNDDTQTSWSMLTQHFKDVNNKDGYGPYADWFGSVDEVQVLSTQVISNSGSQSTVRAELAYYMKDGRKDTYDLMEFGMVRDPSTNAWMIDTAKMIKGTR